MQIACLDSHVILTKNLHTPQGGDLPRRDLYPMETKNYCDCNTKYSIRVLHQAEDPRQFIIHMRLP